VVSRTDVDLRVRGRRHQTPGHVVGSRERVGHPLGPEWRAKLGPQFVEHLAKIHSYPVANGRFTTMEAPSVGTTEAARCN
jgi:hypothetical protein